MTTNARAGTRPNFVIVMPDQLRADALGCFGNSRASTPHLDAFAATATVFTQAYSQHPVCSPSRVSMFTGRYPHTTGHRTLTHLIQPGEPNVFRSLKQAGYHVAWLAPRGDTYAEHATEESADEYGFIVEPDSSVGGVMGQQTEEEPKRTWDRLFYGGSRGAEPVLDYDEAAIRSAELWLESPPDRPWVLTLPLLFPHCPFVVEEPWFSQHDRRAVPAPAGQKTGPQPAFIEAIRKVYGIEHVTEEMWREVIAVYYGMVSRVDDQFGRVQKALQRNGLTDHTVTIFMTDHGEYIGDYGLIEKWPAGLDDVLLRNPLMIGGAGLPRGQRVESLVELVDILPTILELAQVDVDFGHFGKSLIDVIADPSREHRQYAFSEGGFRVEEEAQIEYPPFPYDLKSALQHERPEAVGRAFSVRSERWTYIYRLYEGDELYDRQADPQELHNLCESFDHQEIISTHRNALMDWLAATSDIIPRRKDPRAPTVELPSPKQQYDARTRSR